MITGNTWFRQTWQERTETGFRKLRERFQIPETGYDEDIEPVEALLNHGAWLVICPECPGGGEYAFEEGWFFCCSCLNNSIGHRYRRFVFPPDREEIEKILALRPLDNRNWRPGESLEDLCRENEEHESELLQGGDR